MAARLEIRQHTHSDAVFIAALLLSMGLHAVAFYLLPGKSVEPPPHSETLSVEIQEPPKPLPPPEPPKPQPAKEKPQPQAPQKKPLPPAPQPKPQAAQIPPAATPAPSAHEPEPVQPPVIAAAPPIKESPQNFTVPTPPPEPPSPPKGPSDQDIENARGIYSNLLAREFAKYKQYPRIAQMRGWQGTVKVELHIDAVGNIRSSTVSESSNFEVLDKQALEMVRKASPLPQPPELLRGREFILIVPVVFRLE